MRRRVVAGIRAWFVLVACSFYLWAARAQMPIYGDYFAHDPGTMIKEGNRYYIFYTGFAIPYKWSTDLRNWTWNATQRIFPSGRTIRKSVPITS